MNLAGVPAGFMFFRDQVWGSMSMKDRTTVTLTSVSEPGGDSEGERARRRPRGEVRVFGKWCKGCGLCIAFCPEHVFEADAEERAVVAYPERCVACMWCYHHCPDFAISVHRLSEDQGEMIDHAH